MPATTLARSPEQTIMHICIAHSPTLAGHLPFLKISRPSSELKCSRDGLHWWNDMHEGYRAEKAITHHFLAGVGVQAFGCHFSPGVPVCLSQGEAFFPCVPCCLSSASVPTADRTPTGSGRASGAVWVIGWVCVAGAGCCS
jgi:hypothetical protein